MPGRGGPESPRAQWQPPSAAAGVPGHAPATLHPPPAVARWRSLTVPARITIGLLLLVILVDAVAVVSDLATNSLLQRNPRAISRPELRASFDRQGAIGILQTVMMVATAIPFIVWFHRAYQNLVALGSGVLRYGTGWAIGGWFVPIMNFFRPKQIVNDVWRASDPDLPADHARRWLGAPISPLYAPWWGGWLTGGALSGVAGWIGLTASTLGDLRTSTLLYLASDLLDIIVAMLAILVVLRTTRRQEERARRVRSVALPATPGTPPHTTAAAPEAPSS